MKVKFVKMVEDDIFVERAHWETPHAIAFVDILKGKEWFYSDNNRYLTIHEALEIVKTAKSRHYTMVKVAIDLGHMAWYKDFHGFVQHHDMVLKLHDKPIRRPLPKDKGSR